MKQSNRLIEVLVYAPLGAGLYALETAPSVLETFVARGRAEIEHQREVVDRRVTTIRSTGQVAVAFGLPMLRKKASDALARVGTVVVRTRPPAPEPPTRTSPAPAEPPTFAPATDPEPAPHAASPSASSNGADLPIPGYDALSASQVVERLVGLAPEELDAVREYETTHRNRRTILGKIDQLTAPTA